MRCLLLFPTLFVLFFTVKTNAQDKPKKTKVEQVKPICEGLSLADKPYIAVMPFKMAAGGASQSVGEGLPDMLMNALFGTGCFRVVERSRLDDIIKEQGLGLSGAGDEQSFAKVGNVAGAQVLIFGTITEFKENESGAGGGGGGILRPRGALGIIAGGIGTSTSHIGYTLRFVNPSTGELLDMKSFDKKKTAVGAAGIGLFPGTVGGGGFYKSKSMQDAVEESLIEATEYMSQKKSMYMEIARERGNSANSSPKASKENCKLLAHKPKIMVLIPEGSINGAGSKYDPNKRNEIDININTPNNGGNGVSRFMSNTPGQAGETEISKKFLEFGLDDLVDQSQFEKIKDDKSIQDAFSNPSEASKVAQKYGADIIIVGQAFSEYSKSENNMSSCRARVEVKAIMVKNARILATEAFSGGGLDATEIMAGKAALKSAGAKIGDYLLAQLCSKSDDIVASMGGKSKTGGAAAANTTETVFQFNSVDFAKASAIAKLLQSTPGVSKVERTSFSDKVAKFAVTHTGDGGAIAEKIMKNKQGIKLDVLSVESGIVNVDVK